MFWHCGFNAYSIKISKNFMDTQPLVANTFMLCTTNRLTVRKVSGFGFFLF